ncbi:MAG TPA: endonuclease/exonuclease/phosphatase family protein [Bryobacteraceae bacterium]|nr:endonuclease/exonuclease/phosphatase family protein [Bryobacteraceae bacterium]
MVAREPGWIKVQTDTAFIDARVFGQLPEMGDIVSFDLGQDLQALNLAIVQAAQTPLFTQPTGVLSPISLSDAGLSGLNLATNSVQCYQYFQPAIATPKMVPVDITLATWNINHLAAEIKGGTLTEREIRELLKAMKLQQIKELVATTNADILVLQEVNSLEDLEGVTDIWTHDVTMGPQMKVEGTINVQKDGTQYEYYPVLYSRRLKLVHTTTLTTTMARAEMSITEKEMQQIPDFLGWTTQRPLVVYHFQEIATGLCFVVGVVHTSPSWKVERTSAEYLMTMSQTYPSVPWVLAGDWYVKPDKIFPMNRVKQSFSTFVDKHDAFMAMPEGNTNFPHKGKGMTADYFIPSKQWEVPSDQKTEKVWGYEEKQVQQIKGVTKATSDHVPVKTVLRTWVKIYG